MTLDCNEIFFEIFDKLFNEKYLVHILLSFYRCIRYTVVCQQHSGCVDQYNDNAVKYLYNVFVEEIDCPYDHNLPKKRDLQCVRKRSFKNKLFLKDFTDVSPETSDVIKTQYDREMIKQTWVIFGNYHMELSTYTNVRRAILQQDSKIFYVTCISSSFKPAKYIHKHNDVITFELSVLIFKNGVVYRAIKNNKVLLKAYNLEQLQYNLNPYIFTKKSGIDNDVFWQTVFDNVLNI